MITSQYYKDMEEAIFQILDKGEPNDKRELLKFLQHHKNIVGKVIKSLELFEGVKE